MASTCRCRGRLYARPGMQHAAAEPALQPIDQCRLFRGRSRRLDKAPVAFVEGEGVCRRNPPVLPAPGQLAQGRPCVEVDDDIFQESVEQLPELRCPGSDAKPLRLGGRHAQFDGGQPRPALAFALHALGLAKLLGAGQGRALRAPGSLCG